MRTAQMSITVQLFFILFTSFIFFSINVRLPLFLVIFLNFSGHSHRVTDLKLVPSRNWIFSTGRDKRLQWNCTKSNRNLGSYEAGAWCLAVEYPVLYI